MSARSISRPMAVLSIALAFTACSGAATPPPQGGGGGGGGAASSSSSQAGSTAPGPAGGTNGYEGTLTTTGIYAATWTAIQGAEVNPFNSVANLTVTSDKKTYGNVSVKADGSVSFGSAAPEFGRNLSFDGTGAKVTLDSSGQFVCAFTVDADLKGHADAAVLHLTGGMTVHWHPVGVGGMNCP